MKNLRQNNLQLQIKNLIPIVEIWIAFLEETKKTQGNLEELPASLEYLKQIENYELKKYHTSTGNPQKDGEPGISQETEIKIQQLISNLQANLPHLIVMKQKINGLAALQERLEALQARELKVVPDYLDELIRLQKNKFDTAKQEGYKPKWRQIIDKHQSKDLRIIMTIVVSILVSWGTAFVVVDNHKIETNLLTEKVEELETRLQQLDSEAAQDNL